MFVFALLLIAPEIRHPEDTDHLNFINKQMIKVSIYFIKALKYRIKLFYCYSIKTFIIEIYISKIKTRFLYYVKTERRFTASSNTDNYLGKFAI